MAKRYLHFFLCCDPFSPPKKNAKNRFDRSETLLCIQTYQMFVILFSRCPISSSFFLPFYFGKKNIYSFPIVCATDFFSVLK